MPSRFTNAPATFQRALDLILVGYKCWSRLVYLDDIIIFSDSVEDKFDQLKEVFTALGLTGISLKLLKFIFLRIRSSNWDIESDPEHTKLKWPCQILYAN